MLTLLLALLLTAGTSFFNSGPTFASPPETDPSTTTTEPSTTTTSTTTLPPTGADFSMFQPCEDPGPVTLSEWASCSTAYNVDRMRSTLTQGLVLLVLLIVTLVLLTGLRR